MFAAYLETLAPPLETSRRRLAAAAAAAADLTAQNLQARVRGAILMALSNRQDRLLLTTGNKSELATGYCTLYGDMAGGLAVISDVPKTLVYRLARAVNAERRRSIPESTLTKPPSAELRPDQTDQDSLPPYDLLDAILDAHLVEGLDAPALVARGFAAAVVDDVVRRVRTERVQAPADAARPEDHRQGVRSRPPLSRSPAPVTERWLNAGSPEGPALRDLSLHGPRSRVGGHQDECVLPLPFCRVTESVPRSSRKRRACWRRSASGGDTRSRCARR